MKSLIKSIANLGFELGYAYKNKILPEECINNFIVIEIYRSFLSNKQFKEAFESGYLLGFGESIVEKL